MSECPLCKGAGTLPERTVHFGDSVPKSKECPVCCGQGAVVIIPTRKTTITIIKPHGVWGSGASG